MNDCLTQINSNESLETSVVKKTMESVPQQSDQSLTSGQQVSPIVTQIDGSQTDQNSVNELSLQSSSNTSVSVSIIPSNASEPQNSLTSAPNLSVTSSSMLSAVVSSGRSAQSPILTPSPQSQQLIVTSSQPQLVPTSQSAHLSAANGLMAQQLGPTITSMANQTMQMSAQQSSQHNQMQPLIQTTVQPTAPNQMSVSMPTLPQMQVIQQPINTTPGTYQFQPVYPQQMLLPGNLTIQNLPFGTTNQGLSLQIPFTAGGVVSAGSMPITSIAAKTPIMSKAMAISPLTSSHHMLSSLKPNIAHNTQQIIKQVLPAQQFMPHAGHNQTVVFSQLLPNQSHHPIQQSILPANTNRGLLEHKGKPFSLGSIRSPYYSPKMFSHSGAIQPKSPILPATSISSSLIANSQFKAPFPANANTTQLITTQTPQSLLNSQILGSFQTLPPGLTWTTSPQSTHLVAPNGSPIFIRGPTQGGEHMFISTSNMSSPHIQTVSMATPISVHNSGAIQVNATHSQSMPMTPTPVAASIQSISGTNTITTTTTTALNTNQPTVIAPTPIAPTTSKARQIRQSNMGTQTTLPTGAQKPQVESTSTLKPIAPAKPKPSPQPISQTTKPVNKEMNAKTMRSTSVGSTQTISHPTPASNKCDASNQPMRVSVGTETTKVNLPSQMPSNRAVNDQNKPLNNKNNTNSEFSQTKVNSEEVKTKRVEKKDASTGEDTDLMSNLFAQQNHKSMQNAIQMTNNSSNHMNQVLSDLNRQDITKAPQKAIVKPQILTHVIDGYIIQESPNPFPVNGLSYSSDIKSLNEEKTNNIIQNEIKSKNKNENTLNSSASSSRNRTSFDRHLCLTCGSKRKSNSKNNRSLKRFCKCSEKFNTNNELNSSPGSRLALYNSVTAQLDGTDHQKGSELSVELSSIETEKQTIEEKKKLKSLKKSQENSIDFNTTKNGEIIATNERNVRKAVPVVPSDLTSDRMTPSVNCVAPGVNTTDESHNSAIAGLYIPPGGRNPLQWSVNDVYEFVRNLQGCTEYADEFRSQEIDGQALMLIKEDHLMNTMNMKLGPALKICSKINALREDVQKQS